jgi:hypothetical protein
VLIVALSVGMTASATSGPPSAESIALNSVYFAALVAGRDPDAAVRKVRFTVHILMKDLGMTRSAALIDEMRRRGGSLCGGT